MSNGANYVMKTITVSGPRRIVLSRKRGWRMPANTVKVCRPTLWGNPHKVEGETSRVDAAFQYKTDLESGKLKDKAGVPLISRVRELEGKNLACWCPEGSCCHADFLLAHANPNASGEQWNSATRRR